MPIFNLCCTVTVSASTRVRAETLEEAIAEAECREIELSFQGSGNDALEVWLVEEIDGSPEDITEA